MFSRKRNSEPPAQNNFAPYDQESFAKMIVALKKVSDDISEMQKIMEKNTKAVSRVAADVRKYTRKP